jgi:hypothetical protein
VPAAAVIPAPIAYIKVAAVKKLVVERWVWSGGPPHGALTALTGPCLLVNLGVLCWMSWGTRTFTLRKLECSKQVFA